MYKICKTEQSLKRQKLFQTTLLSMMEHQNYQDITVTSLCKEMNIPRKTFYRYFNTLEDVLNLTIEEVLTESFLFLETKADLLGYFTYWREKKYFLDVFEKNGLSALLIINAHDRLIFLEDTEDSIKKQILYPAYITTLFTILLSWHHLGMEQSVEEICQLTLSMFRMV